MIPPLHQEINTLYQAHHAWLVEWLRRRIGCVHNAKDLAQDTFLKVIDRTSGGYAINEPKAFLSRVAHDLMVDQVRRRDIEKAYIDALTHLPSQQVDSDEERMIIVQALMRIDALFDGQHRHVRTVFLYSRLQGMTHVEIAKKMGVSLRTVETYMSQAIAHILVSA